MERAWSALVGLVRRIAALRWRCPYCGADVSQWARRCWWCGRRFYTMSPAMDAVGAAIGVALTAGAILSIWREQAGH